MTDQLVPDHQKVYTTLMKRGVFGARERYSEDVIHAVAQHYKLWLPLTAQPQPTRRERGQGTQPVPDKLVLWLDTIGGKFRQR